MSAEVIAVVLTGVGVVAAVLLGVWRIVRVEVNAVETRLGAQIGDVRREIGDVRRDLTGQIGEVNRRIDAVLLADRDARRAS